jgi:hypothetical protein
MAGIEPASDECRSSILPLNDTPRIWCWWLESNQLPGAHQAPALPMGLTSMEPRARVELASPAYRAGASRAMLAGPNLEPRGRLERPSQPYQGRASPSMLSGLEPELVLETRSPRYEGGTLPLELFRPELERVEEIESSSLVWKTRAQPLYDTR